MADRIVAVRWDDAHVALVDSYTREEIKDRVPTVFTTFGILVRDDERLVAVAAERCEDATYRGVTYIPRAMVREVLPVAIWPKRTRTARAGPPTGDAA